jgi:transposase
MVEHRPDRCWCCSAALMADLPSETISIHEQIELPAVAPRVTQHRRLAVHCPSCGTRAVAPVPQVARQTPFGPRLHAVATYLKTFQTLSYERLQSAFADLFGLTISQGGLMNLLRRAQGAFVAERDKAITALHQAKVVASDETGVRIEGSNAYHWVFRCSEAVVHHASATWGAIVVRTTMDGHRPEVWCSDRYSAQQGHVDAHQTCLAHLARKRRALERSLEAILTAPTSCDLARDLQNKFRRARDQLLTFAHWPGMVDATNNACERALRPAVIQRKVTNGYRAMWAAEGEADIRTVIDTARLRPDTNTFKTILQTVSA